MKRIRRWYHKLRDQILPVMKTPLDERPELTNRISVLDFKDFYWLKNELIAFCKENKLRSSGSKREIAERIVHYLETGQEKEVQGKTKIRSRFDWKSETLSLETQITDNYSNTENVRNFFSTQIGKQFKFNVKFMAWLKDNEGRTLQEAITEWHRIKTESKTQKGKKDIAPQFEYNTYLRDFMADNPGLPRSTGIQLWKIIKAKRGDNIYTKDDLQFLK